MRIRVSKIQVLILATTLLLSPVSSLAKGGRDFAGVYNVSHVVDEGNQMVLTLQLHLFNHSDADLNQAVVMLRASQPAQPAMAQFQPIKQWKNHSEVRLTKQLVVSRHEYDLWQKGTQPAVFVVYHDAKGQRFERFAQLSSRPGELQ